MIRLFFNTGARRAEIANLRYSPTDPNDRDFDVRKGSIKFVDKGAKSNNLKLDGRTLDALETYLMKRKKHPHADEPWLWIGRKGRLTDSGIAQTIRDRGMRPGIPNLHAHDFRHSATHHELANGVMTESDVMAKRGWDSPAMLRRYAASTANERMNDASRRLALGDKV